MTKTTTGNDHNQKEEPAATTNVVSLVDTLKSMTNDNDQVLAIAADIEKVAHIGFDGDVKATMATLLQVMKNASIPVEEIDGIPETVEPFVAARDWLDAWLDQSYEPVAPKRYEVYFLPLIAAALAEGKDLINDSSDDGGIFVTDEIITLAADIEDAVKLSYAGKYDHFITDLQSEIARSHEYVCDPMGEVKIWLSELLEVEVDGVLSA